MEQNGQRRLHSPEEMLSLAEELAAKRGSAAGRGRQRLAALPSWVRAALWFFTGAGAGWLLASGF